MPLATEEKQEILQLIRQEIPVILSHSQSKLAFSSSFEMEIRERIVRVEEELKHQRELMMEGFKRMDERMEAMEKRFEAKFDAIDKRFEDLIHYMDKRFEDMNSRFSFLQWSILAGFSFITLLLGILTYLAKTGFFT